MASLSPRWIIGRAAVLGVALANLGGCTLGVTGGAVGVAALGAGAGEVLRAGTEYTLTGRALRTFTASVDSLQEAARTAQSWGRREVDTEHLLHALAGGDVVRTVLEQYKLSGDELRQQLEREARQGEGGGAAAKDPEIGVSPRVKDALGRAFAASRELGHSYVGPEHLLIGLAEEDEGLAGEVLRRLSLTPQALRQQIVKVVGRGAEEGRVERPVVDHHLHRGTCERPDALGRRAGADDDVDPSYQATERRPLGAARPDQGDVRQPGVRDRMLQVVRRVGGRGDHAHPGPRRERGRGGSGRVRDDDEIVDLRREGRQQLLELASMAVRDDDGGDAHRPSASR